MEQFLAYKFYCKQCIIYNEDLSQIPKGLTQDILWYNWRGLLNGLFGEFGSENLVKEIASKLKIVVYLPSDYIIEKDQVGKEMFFIVEGSV